ncbi:dipeptidase, partial [Streptomyces kasugaensis]
MNQEANDPDGQPPGAGRSAALESTADALLPGVRADLERLAAIPSIAFPGLSPEPVLQARDLVVA